MKIYDDNEGEVRLRRTFVGRYVPEEARNFDHIEGFDAALRNALDVFDRAVEHNKDKELRDPGTFHVSVSFEAVVVVRSPGNIGEYRAIVTEKGHS